MTAGMNPLVVSFSIRREVVLCRAAYIVLAGAPFRGISCEVVLFRALGSTAFLFRPVEFWSACP